MKIRIGNDIHMVWTILKDDKPYTLNDTAKVKLLDPFNKPVVCEYTIKNNIIDVIYRGKVQVTYGKYSLLLVENEDIDDMISVDAHDIFELTKRTYRNIGEHDTDVMVDVPEITSNVGVGEIYHLPIANSTTLGGVMPEDKTGEMTQVVGVDAVGKLYTKDFKYDLPVANHTTLGGVKPVAKTEKMTKDVGIDIEGKLYVEIPTVEPYDDTQVKADIKTNSEKISENNAAIKLKADKTELDKLATKEELKLKADKTELTSLATKQEVENAKYNDTQVKADIKKNTDDIAALNTALNGAEATVTNINNIIG